MTTSYCHHKVTEGNKTWFSSMRPCKQLSKPWKHIYILVRSAYNELCRKELLSSLGFYCNDTIGAKNVTAVNHGLIVQIHSHRCIAIIEEIERLSKWEVRHRVHTTHVRQFICACDHCSADLNNTGDFSHVRDRKKH